ncbi:hypothetical protein COCVIDRAFT_16406 [Bipolaris victoriae FI3]|uniref:Uncharacterized protein n=1 Tax=Bipolaris victoriae (strain FI3) TaxID=930091 RepID=W7ERE8_BIPV3|nr:hypothetical protein COCVIDRAFT_16406 [Bipolaris victoriae FI3]
MVNTSHSRSVRGTLSHPNRSPSSSQPPPSLSDATSLTPENASLPLPPHDSAPPPSLSQTPTSSSSSPADAAPTPSTPYRTLGTAAGGGDKRAVGNRAANPASKDSAKDVAGDAVEDILPPKGNATQSKTQDGKRDEEPHSRRVRGTLANKKPEARVEKTMLGDPASLIPEGEKTEGGVDKGAESEGVVKRESKL